MFHTKKPLSPFFGNAKINNILPNQCPEIFCNTKIQKFSEQYMRKNTSRKDLQNDDKDQAGGGAWTEGGGQDKAWPSCQAGGGGGRTSPLECCSTPASSSAVMPWPSSASAALRGRRVAARGGAALGDGDPRCLGGNVPWRKCANRRGTVTRTTFTRQRRGVPESIRAVGWMRGTGWGVPASGKKML